MYIDKLRSILHGFEMKHHGGGEIERLIYGIGAYRALMSDETNWTRDAPVIELAIHHPNYGYTAMTYGIPSMVCADFHGIDINPDNVYIVEEAGVASHDFKPVSGDELRVTYIPEIHSFIYEYAFSEGIDAGVITDEELLALLNGEK